MAVLVQRWRCLLAWIGIVLRVVGWGLGVVQVSQMCQGPGAWRGELGGRLSSLLSALGCVRGWFVVRCWVGWLVGLVPQLSCPELRVPVVSIATARPGT